MIICVPHIFLWSERTVKGNDRPVSVFWCEKYLLKKTISEGPFGRKGLLLLVGGMKKEIGIQCGEGNARHFSGQ